MRGGYWRREQSNKCYADPASPETFEGVSYTELHHIVPLADGGQDTIDNAVGGLPKYLSDIDMKIEIKILNILQFTLVMHIW